MDDFALPTVDLIVAEDVVFSALLPLLLNQRESLIDSADL